MRLLKAGVLFIQCPGGTLSTSGLCLDAAPEVEMQTLLQPVASDLGVGRVTRVGRMQALTCFVAALWMCTA